MNDPRGASLCRRTLAAAIVTVALAMTAAACGARQGRAGDVPQARPTASSATLPGPTAVPVTEERSGLIGGAAPVAQAESDAAEQVTSVEMADDSGCADDLARGQLSHDLKAKARLTACTAKADEWLLRGESLAAANDFNGASHAWQMATRVTLPDAPAVRLSRMRLAELAAAVGQPAALCHFAAALAVGVRCHPSLEAPLEEVLNEAGCPPSFACTVAAPAGLVEADAVDKEALGCMCDMLVHRPRSAEGKALSKAGSFVKSVPAYAKRQCRSTPPSGSGQ